MDYRPEDEVSYIYVKIELYFLSSIVSSQMYRYLREKYIVPLVSVIICC